MTPRSDGYAPADMFFGRRPRSRLPALPQPQIDLKQACDTRKQAKEKSKSYFDRHSRIISELHVGQEVLMQDRCTKKWIRPATVVEKLPNGRSYFVESNGRRYRRNRRFLRLTPDKKARDTHEKSSEALHEAKETHERAKDSDQAILKPILKKTLRFALS